MAKRRIIFGLAVCLLLGVFGQRLLSQGMRPGRLPARPDFERMRRMSPEEKVRYFRRMAEEQRRMAKEQEAEAMKQALEVDERQWKVIEPKLKKVRACRDQAFVGIGLPFQSSFTSSVVPSPGGAGGQSFGGGFSGGFQFQAGGGGGTVVNRSSPWQDFGRQPTEGEKICEELQLLLQVPEDRPDEIRQKLDALRKAREKAGKQLVKAQQELRKVLTFRQQARLVLMGLLD